MDRTVSRNFRKAALEIEEIKLKWNEKIKQLQNKGFTEKEMQNMKWKQVKLKDLEFLKSQSNPGSSYSTEEVTKYLQNTKHKDAPRNTPKNDMFIGKNISV